MLAGSTMWRDGKTGRESAQAYSRSALLFKGEYTGGIVVFRYKMNALWMHCEFKLSFEINKNYIQSLIHFFLKVLFSLVFLFDLTSCLSVQHFVTKISQQPHDGLPWNVVQTWRHGARRIIPNYSGGPLTFFSSATLRLTMVVCVTKTVTPNCGQLYSDAALSVLPHWRGWKNWHCACVVSGLLERNTDPFLLSLSRTADFWPLSRLASPQSMFYLNGFCSWQLSELGDPLKRREGGISSFLWSRKLKLILPLSNTHGYIFKTTNYAYGVPRRASTFKMQYMGHENHAKLGSVLQNHNLSTVIGLQQVSSFFKSFFLLM